MAILLNLVKSYYVPSDEAKSGPSHNRCRLVVAPCTIYAQPMSAGRGTMHDNFLSMRRLCITTLLSQHSDLTRFNKLAIQGTHQMAVDMEVISLSRVHSHYSTCNLP